MAVPKSQAAISLQRRFAENVVLQRDRAGLSQGMAAERSGLHITQISLLERGLRLPRLNTIVKLAGAFEVEPCELLTGMTWRLARPTVERPGAYVPQGSFEVETVERAESP